MKLLSQTSRNWKFLLNSNEAILLRGLLERFPFTDLAYVRVSRADASDSGLERDLLLNESLAEHRQELKAGARTLLWRRKWKETPEGHVYTLNPGARDLLLQILNDIRIGSWQAIGQPEILHRTVKSAPELAHRQLMELAGYFEACLLQPED